MPTEEQLKRLRRFDRRLRVVPSRKGSALVDVVYKDAKGREVVALRGVYELGHRELKQLVEGSPWRRGLTYGSLIRSLDEAEIQRARRLDETMSEERARAAFDKLQFYRRGRGVKFDGRRMSA